VLVNISGIYSEENTIFRISHKVDKLIMEKLTALNLSPNEKTKIKNREYIGFLITTGRNCNKITVNEPFYPRKSKFVDIGIVLPYFNETNENNYVKYYLDNIEIGIINGFKKIDIEDDRIINVFQNIKTEVIGNENYKYVEEFTQRFE
jgi:hypothetical protein